MTRVLADARRPKLNTIYNMERRDIYAGMQTLAQQIILYITGRDK